MARLQPGVLRRGPLAAAVLASGAALGGALALGRAARRAGRGADRRPATVVRGVDPAAAEVRLSATAEALQPGRWSLWFAGGRGHARVGDVLRREGRVVVRELLGVDRGDLAAATEARFNGWMHLTPASLGLPWRDERVRTTEASLPAWTVPAGDGSRWAVLVHGRSSVRQEALRAVPVLHAAGWTVLLPAYRGDGEVPEDPAQRYAVPDAEWVDVESAVLHALDAGAREVLLAAWSSGAAIALAAAHRSGLRSVVSGVLLDSPLLPRGLDAAEPDARVLVLHSEDDGVAPVAASRAFVAARPGRAVLVPFAGARHTRLWNIDPVRWERAVAAWLADDGEALAALSETPVATGRRGGRSRPAAGRAAPR